MHDGNSSGHGLDALDWSLVAVYFVVVFAVAWLVTRRATTRTTTNGYFLAGRDTGWFVVGGSLFATNIGSEHLVGLAGTGAASGMAVGQFEILASLILLALGWLFVPFYVRSSVVTMPEFLERRYSSAARWYLAIVSIAAYVLTKISVTIAAGGIVFEALMGIDFWTGALVVVVATGVYTIFGGLRAVLYTDLLQVFVLVGGAVTATAIGLHAAGGWSVVRASAGDEFFNLWKPMSDPSFPWTGILFGAPILGVWYWCTDQYIVQRVLSAKGECDARRGTIFAGFLKVLPLFIFVLPGIAAHVLAKQGKLDLPNPDAALPTLVATLFPSGARGIVVAGLLAALMSSLSSVFNSCSTLITWDIYKRLSPNASEQKLVRVGQIATAVLVVLGLLWIPMMKHVSGQLYQYLQSVQAYISPPIAAVFLIGILHRRVNARGAMAALLTGLVLGSARLAAELGRSSLDGVWLAFAEINFLHFALFLFVVCSVVLVGVSLTAPAPSDAQLRGLVRGHLGPSAETSSPEVRAREVRVDLILTLVLVGLVGAVWIAFRG